MVKVIFKNLQKSEQVRSAAIEKVEKAIDKFALLEPVASTVILSRGQSRAHAGEAEFGVKLVLGGRGRKQFVVQKYGHSIQQVLSMALDCALELLLESFAKERVALRSERRRWKSYQRWRQSFATWNQLGA